MKSALKKPIGPTDSDIRKAAKITRALDNPLRWEIMAHLDRVKSSAVQPIYKALNLDQSIASQHLNILREANLVLRSVNGKQREYTLNYDRIREVNIILQSL